MRIGLEDQIDFMVCGVLNGVLWREFRRSFENQSISKTTDFIKYLSMSDWVLSMDVVLIDSGIGLSMLLLWHFLLGGTRLGRKFVMN